MISRIVNLTCKTYCKNSSRALSTVVTSRSFVNYKKSIIFFGSVGSLSSYDYFFRDAESLGAVIRFSRSLKIALQVSIDYNVGLYGLDENSEEYDKVNNKIHDDTNCACNKYIVLLFTEN